MNNNKPDQLSHILVVLPFVPQIKESFTYNSTICTQELSLSNASKYFSKVQLDDLSAHMLGSVIVCIVQRMSTRIMLIGHVH